MSISELVSRATLANIVAAILVLIGITYCWQTSNTDGVLLLTGAGIGWLFKEVKQ